MPIPAIIAGIVGLATTAGGAAAAAAGTVAAAAGTAAAAAGAAAATVGSAAAAAAGTAAAAAGTAAATVGTTAAAAAGTAASVAGAAGSAAIATGARVATSKLAQAAVVSVATKVYSDKKAADAHTEGKKEGYEEAAAEFAAKIDELTQYFMNEKKVMADKVAEYEELLDFYEEMIKGMESKQNKTAKDMHDIRELKLIHYDLMNLEKCS